MCYSPFIVTVLYDFLGFTNNWIERYDFYEWKSFMVGKCKDYDCVSGFFPSCSKNNFVNLKL